MSTVKKFEKQPVIPDPPNTRTDIKSVFLQKADVFNPALKAWADSFNVSVVDNLNALVDVLNQQLPYINTVSDADAAIRAVYTAIAQVNTVSAGIENVNTCATWIDKIKLVAENMAEVVSAQGYAEEARKWALMAEAAVNIKPATKETLGLVMVGTGLNIDLEGTLDVAPDQISSTTAGGVITVKDVAIGGDLGDLASARGQIGNAKEMPNLDFNTLTTPGNYRITGNPTNGPSLPLNISGASIGSLIVAGTLGQHGRIFQIMISGSAVTWRTIQNSTGATWGAWQQLLSGNKVGDGIRVTNGTISVPEYEGATASTAGTSGLVPPAAAGQATYVLCGDGEWRDIATLVAAAQARLADKAAS